MARKTVTPSKQKAEAAEKHRASRLEASIRELLDEDLPMPPAHRVYAPGTRVQYGAHPETIVIAVYGEGRVYHVKSEGLYKEYGQEVRQVHESVLGWVELLPYSDPEKAQPPSVVMDPTYRPLNFSQRAIESLMHMMAHDRIDMNPIYQRPLCWNDADKHLLLESVFERRDIGKFVIVHNGFEKAPFYEVLDGKQRLSALWEFFQDRFRYRGLLFSELCALDQRVFENAPVSYAELSGLSEAEKMRAFLRLNISGRQQSPEWLAEVQAMLNAKSKP